MTRMADVRPRLDWFVDQMRARLAAKDNQRKDDWRELDLDDLLQRLQEELDELTAALENGKAEGSAIRECADLANFAMMLADRLRQLELLNLPNRLKAAWGQP